MPSRQEVFTRLHSSRKLPSPSRTAMEIIRLCANEDTSLTDIANIIQTDPALSAELLKYANAAFLATGVQVASLHKATVKLGMRTVVNLALGLSLLADNKQGKCPTFDYDQFWSVSLLQAIAAKAIAGYDLDFDPEEVFICALLSHMGQLALASLFPEEYGALLAEHGFRSTGQGGITDGQGLPPSSPANELRKALEMKKFAISSSEMTVELFLEWGLPADYALAAGFHDDLDYAELGRGRTQRLAELLNLAHHLAWLGHQDRPAAAELLAIAESAHSFKAMPDDFGQVFDDIIRQWHDWGQVFHIHTRPCPLSATILADPPAIA